ESRKDRPGMPAVTIRDLVKMSLRLRPDRLLVGEVRGEEAFDLLQALNTGHSGSLSTIHANSAVQALSKLANYVLLAGVDLPYAAIRGVIADSVNVIVQVERRQSDRLVTEVVFVDGFDHVNGKFELRSIYRLDAIPQELEPAEPRPPRRAVSS